MHFVIVIFSNKENSVKTKEDLQQMRARKFSISDSDARVLASDVVLATSSVNIYAQSQSSRIGIRDILHVFSSTS